MRDRQKRWAQLSFLPLVVKRLLIRMWTRTLRGAAHGLLQALPKLPSVSRDLERIYLEIQDKLERLSEVAKKLVGEARELVVMASGQETGAADFERTMAVLQAPTEFLGAAVAEIPLLASDLSAAGKTVAETIALEKTLERTLSPLRFMQTMFRIESVMLPAESRGTFDALAGEIGALFEEVQQSLGDQFQKLAKIEISLREAVEEMQRYHRDHLQRLTERRAEIEHTLSGMAEEVQQNGRRNVELTEASDDFATAVNEALMAMQTQDIVAQRLEHAASGLRDAVAALGAAGSETDPEALGKVPTLAHIEVAQLDAVMAELNKSEQSIRTAAGKVTARVGGLDQDCLLLREFEHLTVSVDGVVQVLIESLGALRGMTAETLDLLRPFEEMLRPAEDALGKLNTSVDQVARGMRRIALNAQIRAVQIGQQTGLEVLASRSAEIANATLALSTDLDTGLSRTAACLAGAIGRLHRLRDAGEQALAVCDKAGAEEEQHLHTFRDQTLARVIRVGELVDRARTAAAAILSSIDVSAPVAALGEVRAIVKILAEVAQKLPLAAADAQVSSVERRYTMSRERAVHHHVLRELGAECQSYAAQNDAASNIELF